jgi:hypothetical protein
MPLQWGHLNKVFALPTSEERLNWLKKAAKNGWSADVLSRQIASEIGRRGAHGRAIKRPDTIEDGLNQLAWDGELWLRLFDAIVELIDEIADAESPNNDDYFRAMLMQGVPNLEMHIYGRGKHGGSIGSRDGIPFGTWSDRFIDWFRDLGFLDKPAVETQAAKDVADFAKRRPRQSGRARDRFAILNSSAPQERSFPISVSSI